MDKVQHTIDGLSAIEGEKERSTLDASRVVWLGTGRRGRCVGSGVHVSEMNSDRAIAIAKAAAEAKGWPWQVPLHVTRRRQFFLFGPASWHITTNANSCGGNVRVSVDDTSGRIKEQGLARY